MSMSKAINFKPPTHPIDQVHADSGGETVVTKTATEASLASTSTRADVNWDGVRVKNK